MLQTTPRQLRPWRAPRSSALSAGASHDRIQAPRHRAEAKKSGSTGSSADDATTPAPAPNVVAARAVAKKLALGGAALALSVSASLTSPLPALAFSSGIPEPSAPPAVVTTSKSNHDGTAATSSSGSTTSGGNDESSTAPPSDGTLQIKFLASPDPEVRRAQTALVEAWGKVSTMYFDHEFGGVDWRGALQEALDDSFRANGASSSSSSSPSSSSSSSSSSSGEEEKRKKSIDGTYDAIDAMLSKLGDPYTRVLRPADAGSYVAGAEGEGLSLGLQLLLQAPTSRPPPPPPSSSSSSSLSSLSSTSSSSSTIFSSLPLPPVVAAVVPNSPAAKAGISAGDSLLAIDGQTTRGRPIEDLALSLTREADVTFLPKKGEGGRRTRAAAASLRELLPRTVHLKPASVSLHAVQWAQIKTKEGEGASQKVAYIRVAAFNRLAPSDVARALDSLFGARSRSGDGGLGAPPPPPVLLLDLRDNSGGAVDAGVDVASLLLPRDDGDDQSGAGRGMNKKSKTFFFGSVRDGAGNEERVEIDASRGKLPAGTRLAVLVNGGTASTSELVAAALRGEEGGKEGGNLSSSSNSTSTSTSSSALLVGEKTFKKARTQRAVPLTGGGLLLVSNLQYISPRGESVDGVGLTPEVSCQPDEVARSFFVSGGDDDGAGSDEILAEDLLFDPCVRVAAEALGAPLAEPTTAVAE